MGIAGNKGGVGIRFRCYETDICFVNCHFASGDGQTQRRNDDYQTIESRMNFSDAPNYSLKDYVWYIAAGTGGTATNSTPPVTNRWSVSRFSENLSLITVVLGGKSMIMILSSGSGI